MGKQLYESSHIVRQQFQEHNAICRKHDLPSFLELIIQDGLDFASASPIQVRVG